jgi:CxxC-x17-CxxC domain-containing protein
MNRNNFQKNNNSRNNNFQRRNNFNNGPREMHKAICSECKQECEVPFKPTEGKEVFCKDCYAKRKPKRF